MMHLGLVLLYVGAVLTLNGLWLLGKIEDREIWVINVFSGLVTVAVAIYAAFNMHADAASARVAALTLLFSFTYLWVAVNRFTGADGRGLGWFSLFVAVTVTPVAISSIGGLPGNAEMLQVILAVSWAIWAVLWFMYYLLLAQGKKILLLTGWTTLLAGIITGWVPALLVLNV